MKWTILREEYADNSRYSLFIRQEDYIANGREYTEYSLLIACEEDVIELGKFNTLKEAVKAFRNEWDQFNETYKDCL